MSIFKEIKKISNILRTENIVNISFENNTLSCSEKVNNKKDKQNRLERKEIARILATVNTVTGNKLSEKILNCGEFEQREFLKKDSSVNKILFKTFCKDPLCPQCSKIRANWNSLVAQRVISEVAIKNQLSLQFWTFSPINVPIKYMGVMINIISQSIGDMFHNKKQYKRAISAHWIVIEYKYNPKLKTVNVHAHTVLGMKQSYFIKNNSDWINVKGGQAQADLVKYMIKTAHNLREEYLHNANPKTGEIKRKTKNPLDITDLIKIIEGNIAPNYDMKNIYNASKDKFLPSEKVEEKIKKVVGYVSKYFTKTEDIIDTTKLGKHEKLSDEETAEILIALREERKGKQLSRPCGLFRKSKVEIEKRIKVELKAERDKKFIDEETGEELETEVLSYAYSEKIGKKIVVGVGTTISAYEFKNSEYGITENQYRDTLEKLYSDEISEEEYYDLMSMLDKRKP